MRDTNLVGIYLSPSTIHIASYDPNGEFLTGDEIAIGEQTTVAWERALGAVTPELPGQGICSVASTSGTAVLVDEHGVPVFEPQMYHESAPEQAEFLQEAVDTADEPGLNIALSPTAPLAKVLRLKQDYPARFAEVEWILSPTTWLLYQLRYGSSIRWYDIETDWTNALKFGADMTASVPEWHEFLYETADISPSLLPTIRPPGSFIGTADSELAQRTGLDGLRLFQGVTDGNAFVLASGCFEPGDTSVTFGGASVIKHVSESIKPNKALYYHRHPIDGYLPGAAFDSGEALRWFCDRILDTTTKRGLELAKSTPAGDEYEIFLQGNRGPFFDERIASSMLGLKYDRSLSTETVHGRLARGLTTGIILSEATYLSIIEEHFDTSIDRVQVMNDDAPAVGEEYDWWNRHRASIWNRRIVEMEPRTIAGLLIPAALISSIYKNPQEAEERLLRRRAVVDPDPELSEQYERETDLHFERWGTVADLFRSE